MGRAGRTRRPSSPADQSVVRSTPIGARRAVGSAQPAVTSFAAITCGWSSSQTEVPAARPAGRRGHRAGRQDDDLSCGGRRAKQFLVENLVRMTTSAVDCSPPVAMAASSMLMPSGPASCAANGSSNSRSGRVDSRARIAATSTRCQPLRRANRPCRPRFRRSGSGVPTGPPRHHRGIRVGRRDQRDQRVVRRPAPTSERATARWQPD